MKRLSVLSIFTIMSLATLSTGCDPRIAAFVAGMDGNANPARIALFDGLFFQQRASFLMFPSFAGGVRVATGDVNGDGLPDLVGAAGPGGGPHIKVRHGGTGETLFNFLAYDTAFVGGVFVATGDVNGDGKADIITGAGAGAGPHVKVFSGADGSVLQSFFAYDAAFLGGVTVAAGDVNGDGKADIITGVQGDSAPQVKVFDGTNQAELHSFFAYDSRFTGGVFVAAGDVNGDGKADVITGAGAGGGPHVKVFNGASGAELSSFFAFDTNFTGGVRVATGDVNNDGVPDVVAGTGPGTPAEIRSFSGRDNTQIGSPIHPFEAAFVDGIFVATGSYSLSSLAALQQTSP
jgi:hypothetical protein